jgi:hypothetical protein
MLPDDLIRDIERRDKDRNRFVAEAVRHELERRRHAELRRSLEQPHPETNNFADEGLEVWAESLPQEDVESLIDPNKGEPVRWVAGNGWTRG